MTANQSTDTALKTKVCEWCSRKTYSDRRCGCDEAKFHENLARIQSQIKELACLQLMGDIHPSYNEGDIPNAKDYLG